MIKRKLGKTDLYINPLGFGGIPIQRISKEEAINLIKCLRGRKSKGESNNSEGI